MSTKEKRRLFLSECQLSGRGSILEKALSLAQSLTFTTTDDNFLSWQVMEIPQSTGPESAVLVLAPCVPIRKVGNIEQPGSSSTNLQVFAVGLKDGRIDEEWGLRLSNEGKNGDKATWGVIILLKPSGGEIISVS